MAPKSRGVAMDQPLSSFSLQEDEEGDSDRDSSSPSLLPTRYVFLSRRAQQQLPLYQYKGADLSLIYKYMLSPLAQWCVDHCVPITMAPNTVTLIGLAWMVSAYATYAYYVPDLNVDVATVPAWIFCWNGLCMLLYQTLDNMDGKQARRTGSSSPLGLLFDHGCDAINTIFGSANWIIGMAVPLPQDNWLAWLLILQVFGVFYVATWEQYHTGELILPIINGPNEGLLGGALLSFTSFWYGCDFWQGTEWYSLLQSALPLPDEWVLRNGDFVLWASTIGFVQEMTLKSFFVIRRNPSALESLFPGILFTASSWMVFVHTAPQIFFRMPRTALHLATLIFVDQTTELMLAHVTSTRFDAWRKCWSFYPLMSLAAWVVWANMNGNALHEEATLVLLDNAMIAYSILVAVYLCWKWVMVIREMCDVLGVWCFDIVTPYPNKLHGSGQTAFNGQLFKKSE